MQSVLDNSADGSSSSAPKKFSEEFKTWMGFMANFIAALEKIPRQDSTTAVDQTVAKYKQAFEVVKEFGFKSEYLDEKDKNVVIEALKNARIYKSIGKVAKTPYARTSSSTSGGDRGRSKFKEGTCYRCGRNNHWRKDCNARTTIDGDEIDDEISKEYKKEKKGNNRSRSREKNSKKKD